MASSPPPPPPTGTPPKTPPTPPPPSYPQPPTIYTPWAQKYGITPVRLSFNAMYNPAYPVVQKSTYTPLLPLHPNATSSNMAAWERLRRWQLIKLKGFTALTLIENDLLAERQMTSAALTNPIHPLFARDRWEVNMDGMIKYPLIDGDGVNQGTWEPKHNDLAWQTLVPALKLASMILTHMHTHPWLDALLLGKVEPLNPTRFPPFTVLKPQNSTAQEHSVFKIRLPGANNAQECHAAFEELQQWPPLQSLAIGIVSTTKAQMGQPHFNSNRVNGFFAWHVDYSGSGLCAIYLAWERLAMLLRKDLSGSDRLCLNLLIANTMMHELMHAVGAAKRHRDLILAEGQENSPGYAEPFLEDEVVAELGCSMDDAVWGGTLQGISNTSDPTGLYLGVGVLKGPQPSLSAFPTLLTPPIPKFDFFRPIQVNYYHGIQQDAFWDFNVRSFAHFRPTQILRGGKFYNLVSLKDRVDPEAEWQVANDQEIYRQAAAPSNRAANIMQRLLMMSPADRISHEKARNVEAAHEKYVELLQERISQTENVWNQVEGLMRGGSEEELAQGLSVLIMSIEEIMQTFAKLLVALGNFDESSPAYYTGKTDAQSFNRGVRRILYDVTKAPSYPTLQPQVYKLLQNVEVIRTRLTATQDNPMGISLEDDISLADQDEADCRQRIADARTFMEAGDHDTAGTMCEQVSRSMSSMLLTKCCARMLLCHSDSRDHMIRRSIVIRTIETLQQAPAPVGREGEQSMLLDVAVKLHEYLLQTQQDDPMRCYFV